MASRYYESEHFRGYAQLRREGLSQWSALHADRSLGYDDFPNRRFLDRLLPATVEQTRVLEYGCGTGPAACFLAARGYRVTAVDLVPDAIAVAKQQAEERGLAINFGVEDVCQWSEQPRSTDAGVTAGPFDVILDSFCLQSIVTDRDRSTLLSGVRGRLAPGGRFVISTAMHDPDRDYGDEHYDPSTGIVWTPSTSETAESTQIGESSYLPNRRHLTPQALRHELSEHGLHVLEQTGPLGGDVVCESSA